MKNLFFVAFIFITSASFAQISFRTGDSGLDAELNVVNTEAESDLPGFKKDLSVEFGISIPIIEDLLTIMRPAEALLTAQISVIANKPIDNVVQSYKANKDKGWGAIAKELGIKPGSAEFHALKGKKKNSAKPSKGKGNGNSGGKGKK